MQTAVFEKVSFSRFFEDMKKQGFESVDEVRKIYDAIALPSRATQGSAGYDFHAPYGVVIPPQSEVLIPTGIRVKMKNSYVLMLFPRSSLGFKYRLQLNNTVGIIDSDYYHAQNEGHVFLKMTNDSKTGKEVELLPGDGMAQGIFVPFGITDDDDADGVRVGGFGSTGR